MSKELQKQFEEQQKQLVTYEKKLKDVVRAYKSLESEKKALEVALEALGAQHASTITTNDEPSSSSECESLSQVEALKQAISTLTVENKKKELAFQADRKALIAKNEQFKLQLEKTQVDISTKKLKEKLHEAEVENEKALNDHGLIVNEMHAKISELYRKLQDREQQVQTMELKLKDMAKLESEMLSWKKKAEATPTVQLLREELANAKTSYEKELSTIIGRYSLNASEIEEKESRIAHFEERIQELSEKAALREQENVELNNVIVDMKTKLAKASGISTSGHQSEEKKPDAKDTYETLVYNFKSTYYKLKTKDSAFDLYSTLGIEKPVIEVVDMKTEIKTTVLSPVSKNTKKIEEESLDGSDSAHKDLNYFKSLIEHLQKKLRVLEKNYDNMKNDHEQTTNSLRHRIAELETLHEKTYAQLTEETKRKVTELEEEMQKQRVRMLEIISEKDREIEITKNSLAALYAENYVSSDPIDPPQKAERNSPQSLANLRYSSESIRSALTYCTEDNDVVGGSRSRSPIKRSISNHFGDTRNIFYEQELTRREQEIVELRNIIRLSEMRTRDIEQSMLTKDTFFPEYLSSYFFNMQYLQIIEALKEEIRVLEGTQRQTSFRTILGRLVLQNSETNIEYLRNIFIQFLHAHNSTGRKHILRAIGAVLKLTPVEMKRVDGWNL